MPLYADAVMRPQQQIAPRCPGNPFRKPAQRRKAPTTMSRRDLVESDRPRASWCTIFGHADTKATSKSQLARQSRLHDEGGDPHRFGAGWGSERLIGFLRSGAFLFIARDSKRSRG